MPSSQDKPASFIEKLCSILWSKEHSKIIYWDSELNGIRILNQKRLQENILPRYFRHNRYASFVRQLNMYDFHKVNLPGHYSVFSHNTFDPKKKENIHLIRRKVLQQKPNCEKEKQRVNLGEAASLKENNEAYDTFMKSSKNMLYKQSIINFLTQKCSNFQDLTETQVLEQITKELIRYKDKKTEFQKKYKKIKSNQKYKRYLKHPVFKHELALKVGIDWIQEDDVFSQLSIEDQLMCKTKKSLPQQSLRFLESGQIYFKKETVANLFSF